MFICGCFRWEGEGVGEVGKDKSTGVVRVEVNPKFYRPTEVVSDPTAVPMSTLRLLFCAI